LETLSHTSLLKVNDEIVRVTGLRRETTVKKILLTSCEVKGKMAFGNSLDFGEGDVHAECA
jgi:hypothetical protein